MELAKNDRFRTAMCAMENCEMRACPNAHSQCELRDYDRSRKYQKSSNSTPPMIPPTPTQTDISALVHRWKLIEPVTSVLNRRPGPLADLVHRSFMVPTVVPDSQLTDCLLKCLADIIRPQTFLLNSPQSFHDLLTSILKVYSSPVGIACSDSGQIAITLEKEVLLVKLSDYSQEDLGLLAFALSFAGLTVTHSQQDIENMKEVFPKIYTDLFNRVRVVDNPSEIIYTAADPFERVTDRATQAKIDAVSNPAPLLPTPDLKSESL